MAESQVSKQMVKGIVQDWNRVHPVGTPITYWPGFIEGPGVKSHIREPAWILPSGVPVAMVQGYAGGIALTHIMNREV